MRGMYPVESARVIARIALEAEASIRTHGYKDPPKGETAPKYSEIVADLAYRAARMQGATAIIVFTATGSSARLVSRYRPPVPIFAFTASAAVARQLSLIYGIRPVLAPDPTTTDEMVSIMDRILLEGGWLKERDSVVYIAGQPIGRPGTTNFLKLHRIGELW